jgi:type IV pilus assembly protein PilA
MQTPPAYPNQAPYQPGPPMQSPHQPQQKKGFPVWAIILLVIVGLFVVLIGVLAALGIYGTRKYLAAAKTAEAKNSIGAISRGAVAAYEREQSVSGKGAAHRLCETANPVPGSMASVKAFKYQPNSATGTDFNVGDEQTGWPCLRFTMTYPIYYRYQYHKGSGYLAPSVSPGPNGFEASAQGDLDGNGVPSTFARTGAVGPNGSVVLATTVFVDNEFE